MMRRGEDSEVSSAAMGHPRVSIVVPCYNDEDNVRPLLARLDPVMSRLGDAEVVLVDDGSNDRTARLAATALASFAHPGQLVRLQRNFGQHAAVLAGMEVSRGEMVVTMDSDLQYPPESIPDLLAAMVSDVRVVSGARAARRDPMVRRPVSRIVSWWLRRQTGSELRDQGSMFRVYDRDVVNQLLSFTHRRRFIPALVAWLGVKVVEVPVPHEARGSAGSRYRIGALIDMFFDLVTGYSIAPFRMLSAIGMSASVLGFLASSVFLLYRVVQGRGISGLVSAFAALFLLLGVQLFLLGSISEYVGRIHVEAQARPYYIVSSVFTNDL